MKIPPLIDWVVEQYNKEPILTVVIGLAVVVLMLYIMRKAAKLFMVLIVLAIVAVGASYFFEGKEKTVERLEKAGEKLTELGEKAADKLGGGEQPKEPEPPK